MKRSPPADRHAWEDAFIAGLRAYGMASRAAQAAGVSDSTPYARRKRSAAFRQRWDQTLADYRAPAGRCIAGRGARGDGRGRQRDPRLFAARPAPCLRTLAAPAALGQWRAGDAVFRRRTRKLARSAAQPCPPDRRRKSSSSTKPSRGSTRCSIPPSKRSPTRLPPFLPRANAGWLGPPPWVSGRGRPTRWHSGTASSGASAPPSTACRCSTVQKVSGSFSGLVGGALHARRPPPGVRRSTSKRERRSERLSMQLQHCRLFATNDGNRRRLVSFGCHGKGSWLRNPFSSRRKSGILATGPADCFLATLWVES